MSLWDVVSGKTARQNRLIDANAARLMGRVDQLPSTAFAGDWCFACMVVSRSLVSTLLLEPAEIRQNGRTLNLSPFNAHIGDVTVEQAAMLLRMVSTHRIATFLLVPSNRSFVERVDHSADNFESTVRNTLELGLIDDCIYAELRLFGSDEPTHGYIRLMRRMWHAISSGEMPADPRGIAYFIDLVSQSGEAFGEVLNRRMSEPRPS